MDIRGAVTPTTNYVKRENLGVIKSVVTKHRMYELKQSGELPLLINDCYMEVLHVRHYLIISEGR